MPQQLVAHHSIRPTSKDKQTIHKQLPIQRVTQRKTLYQAALRMPEPSGATIRSPYSYRSPSNTAIHTELTSPRNYSAIPPAQEETIFFTDRSQLNRQERMQYWDKRVATLLSFPNVLVTPHIAFLTIEALANIADTTIDNLSAAAKGEPPAVARNEL